MTRAAYIALVVAFCCPIILAAAAGNGARKQDGPVSTVKDRVESERQAAARFWEVEKTRRPKNKRSPEVGTPCEKEGEVVEEPARRSLLDRLTMRAERQEEPPRSFIQLTKDLRDLKTACQSQLSQPPPVAPADLEEIPAGPKQVALQESIIQRERVLGNIVGALEKVNDKFEGEVDSAAEVLAEEQRRIEAQIAELNERLIVMNRDHKNDVDTIERRSLEKISSFKRGVTHIKEELRRGKDALREKHKELLDRFEEQHDRLLKDKRESFARLTQAKNDKLDELRMQWKHQDSELKQAISHNRATIQLNTLHLEKGPSDGLDKLADEIRLSEEISDIDAQVQAAEAEYKADMEEMVKREQAFAVLALEKSSSRVPPNCNSFCSEHALDPSCHRKKNDEEGDYVCNIAGMGQTAGKCVKTGIMDPNGVPHCGCKLSDLERSVECENRLEIVESCAQILNEAECHKSMRRSVRTDGMRWTQSSNSNGEKEWKQVPKTLVELLPCKFEMDTTTNSGLCKRASETVCLSSLT